VVLGKGIMETNITDKRAILDSYFADTQQIELLRNTKAQIPPLIFELLRPSGHLFPETVPSGTLLSDISPAVVFIGLDPNPENKP